MSRIEDDPAQVDGEMDPRVRATLDRYVVELEAQLEAVYRFRFERGQSQEETCKALGITRATLRTRENHLRRGLRKALVRAGITRLESPARRFRRAPGCLPGPRQMRSFPRHALPVAR